MSITLIPEGGTNTVGNRRLPSRLGMVVRGDLALQISQSKRIRIDLQSYFAVGTASDTGRNIDDAVCSQS